MLDTVPTDVLEHIAFFCAIDPLAGPPSTLFSLLAVKKSIYDALSYKSNTHLYARIFLAKFDVAAPVRRLGKSILTSTILTNELLHRCRLLTRFRSRTDCFTCTPAKDTQQYLWTAFLMVLEDDGLNGLQLYDYAQIHEWTWSYLFHKHGRSGAYHVLQEGLWPNDSTSITLAMWLFWMFLDPDEFMSVDREERMRNAFALLKPFALGAHQFPISRLHWAYFPLTLPSFISFIKSKRILYTPPPPVISDDTGRMGDNYPRVPLSDDLTSHQPSIVHHFGQDLALAPLPISIPAIAAYFTLRSFDASTGSAMVASTGVIMATAGLGGLMRRTNSGVGNLTVNPRFIRYPTRQITSDISSPPTNPNSRYISNRSPSSITPSSITPSSISTANGDSMRWEDDWVRCLKYGEIEKEALSSVYATSLSESNVRLSPRARTLFQINGWSQQPYRLGSMEGIWEGAFSYTEFMSYAAILSGAGPQTLQSSLIAQHRQTWKIREHHLLFDDVHGDSKKTGPTRVTVDGEIIDYGGLPSGDPLRAHVPEEVRQAQLAALPTGSNGQRVTPTDLAASLRSLFQEDADGVRISLELPVPSQSSTESRTGTVTGEPLTRKHVFNYTASSTCPVRTLSSISSTEVRGNGEGKSMSDNLGTAKNETGGPYEDYASRVSDILLTGEGHSSWGEFRLIGRVRRYDGLVSICKEYIDSDRGRWLYRGYWTAGGLDNGSVGVGGADGHFIGRWRDTLSPAETVGYEGCFGMTRRR